MLYSCMSFDSADLRFNPTCIAVGKGYGYTLLQNLTGEYCGGVLRISIPFQKKI